MRRILSVIALAAVVGLSGASLSDAQAQVATEQPVLLRADWLTHDRVSEIVTAEGHVELAAQVVAMRTEVDTLRSDRAALAHAKAS